MCSYLYRHGAVYCTRLAVPPRLRPIIGKSDLGRSLKTKDQAKAKRLLPAWLEEAQSTIAAAEAELARRAAPVAAVANGPLTQAEADWQAENDQFWRQVDIEDEAKGEAAEAFEARLQRPEAELTHDALPLGSFGMLGLSGTGQPGHPPMGEGKHTICRSCPFA